MNSLACFENQSVAFGGWEMRFVTRPTTEIEISGIYTAGFSLNKVGRIRVNVKDNVACMVSDDCIGISFSIIKKPFCLLHSVFCCPSLKARDIVEGTNHIRI